MTPTSWDDFPVHQASEYIAHPATSDRNFYDRYYFNMHPCSGSWFAIFGFGQYPNLGVVDAFVDVRRRRRPVHRAGLEADGRPVRHVRRPIAGRGPRAPAAAALRGGAERAPGGSMDVVWEGHIPAVEEPRQFLRSKGRVVFDTQRLAQTGTLDRHPAVDGEEIVVTPEHCWGCRDRSWGVRPVGEPDGTGSARASRCSAACGTTSPCSSTTTPSSTSATRATTAPARSSETERIWSDPERPIEDLGPVEHEHHLEPGTRVLTGSTLRFPAPAGRDRCEPLLANFISMGTGYGIDRDWRHGMYQGPEPVVQGLVLKVDEIRPIAQYGIVDQVARFTYRDQVGYGLYEHGFFGACRRYGLTDGAMGAPAV